MLENQQTEQGTKPETAFTLPTANTNQPELAPESTTTEISAQISSATQKAIRTKIDTSQLSSKDNRTLFLYSQECLNHPLLTPEEEYELARLYHEKGDPNARNKLIQSNLRLVAKIAWQFSKDPTLVLDLIQEGNIGLITAIDKFEPERNLRLSTYAEWWIMQAIRYYMARQSPKRKPINSFEKHNALSKQYKETLQELQKRDPEFDNSPIRIALAIEEKLLQESLEYTQHLSIAELKELYFEAKKTQFTPNSYKNWMIFLIRKAVGIVDNHTLKSITELSSDQDYEQGLNTAREQNIIDIEQTLNRSFASIDPKNTDSEENTSLIKVIANDDPKSINAAEIALYNDKIEKIIDFLKSKKLAKKSIIIFLAHHFDCEYRQMTKRELGRQKQLLKEPVSGTTINNYIQKALTLIKASPKHLEQFIEILEVQAALPNITTYKLPNSI